MIHVFPYSKRQGTVAATMDGQIAEQIKHQRVKELSTYQARIQEQILRSYISKTPTVLFETYENGMACGHTSNFIEVACASPVPLHAKSIPVLIESVDCGRCIGTPILSM